MEFRSAKCLSSSWKRLEGVHAGRSLTFYFLDILLRSGFIDHVLVFTHSPMNYTFHTHFSTPTRTFTFDDNI